MSVEEQIPDREYEQKERRQEKLHANRLKRTESTGLATAISKVKLSFSPPKFPIVISKYNRRYTDDYAPTDFEMVRETARVEAIYLKVEAQKKRMARLYKEHIEGIVFTKKKPMHLLPIRTPKQVKKTPITWLTRTSKRQRIRPDKWVEDMDIEPTYEHYGEEYYKELELLNYKSVSDAKLMLYQYYLEKEDLW